MRAKDIARPWRVLASDRDGDVNLKVGSTDFDELVLGKDAWLHLERMNAKQWWLRVGEQHFDIDLDGKEPRIYSRGMGCVIKGDC